MIYLIIYRKEKEPHQIVDLILSDKEKESRAVTKESPEELCLLF